MAQPTDISYLAGYFDGEGCVCFTKASKKYPHLRISVASADKEVIELFLETFGGTIHKESGGVKRQMYRWYSGGGKAQEILKILLPYLKAKRKQAELALIPDFRQGKHGTRIPEAERVIRLKILQEIQAINQRVTIDNQLKN